ncbi:unnamed protein product [Protopolystoma xenopodis]|uniref:Uncharacterized protein n=1 Tax=Protopolystoma xenopodis TaxID=117903 RepID=A0A448WP56_9PLAT|nr:unnamed protein product [Protopolystoma xenopodis]
MLADIVSHVLSVDSPASRQHRLQSISDRNRVSFLILHSQSKEKKDRSFNDAQHVLSESPSCPVGSICYLPGSSISLDSCPFICATRGVITPPLRLGD